MASQWVAYLYKTKSAGIPGRWIRPRRPLAWYHMIRWAHNLDRSNRAMAVSHPLSFEPEWSQIVVNPLIALPPHFLPRLPAPATARPSNSGHHAPPFPLLSDLPLLSPLSSRTSRSRPSSTQECPTTPWYLTSMTPPNPWLALWGLDTPESTTTRRRHGGRALTWGQR
jgi:hypothetical protein